MHVLCNQHNKIYCILELLWNPTALVLGLIHASACFIGKCSPCLLIFQGHHPGAASAANGRRVSNTFYLNLINPPGVVTAVYRGVARRGTGGGTERSAGINQGKIVDRGT